MPKFPFSYSWKKPPFAQCILADPPWRFDDRLDPTRRLSRHYETMTPDDIGQLPVEKIAANDCVLLMWSPASMVRTAIFTMHVWGWRYKTMFIWVKPRMGMGHYFRTAHECLLLGTRGHPQVKFKGQPSWIMAPVQEHSHKPEEVYVILERMFDGPYVELFARRRRKGWRSWGKQLP